MSDSEHAILAGVLQKPSRIVDVVGIDQAFFVNPETRNLFQFTIGYFDRRERKNSLDIPLARTLLEKSSAKAAPVLLELVEEYSGYDPISDSEFRESLASIATERQRRLVRDGAARAIDAVVDGDYQTAEMAMRAGLLAIEDADLDAERPVNIRSSGAVAAERVEADRAPDDRSSGFDVGFSQLTDRVSFLPGELTVLGGYASDGKTQLSKTLLYNASVNSRARCLFVALEMTRREMQVLIVAQHAATINPRGVDYRAILTRSATSADKKLYHRALDDFDVEDHEEDRTLTSAAGSIHIWSPKKRIDMNQFRDRARAQSSEEGLDVLCGDYLELIDPSKDMGQYRLNLKRQMEEGKELSRELEIWTILNHQISRPGRDSAEKRDPPHYLMRDLGESSGIERAVDHFVWVFCDEYLESEHEAKVGLGKARKGRKCVQGFHVLADYARANVAPLGQFADDR